MVQELKKKVAVFLAGAGVFDGSEIQETVLCLLRLAEKNCDVQCFAPDIAQHEVINHYNQQACAEKRNVLQEAARITRGDILPLTDFTALDFDALIVPGGFGVAKNFCDFAIASEAFKMQPTFAHALSDFASLARPVGLLCIAPVVAVKIYGQGVRCTIGNDEALMATLTQLGACHIECDVDNIVVDDRHKLVSTPAYMLAGNIAEAARGIFKLVDAVLALS